MRIKHNGALVLAIIVGGYGFAVSRDVRKVHDFCAEMRPGLDVHKIAQLAEKYDVGYGSIRDPDSADKHKLGIEIDRKDHLWYVAVGSPLTLGEYGCKIRHDNHVVLSVKK